MKVDSVSHADALKLWPMVHPKLQSTIFVGESEASVLIVKDLFLV